MGCSEPLLGDVKPRSDYHGSDGFGDAPDPNAPDDSHLQTEHAVQALLRLTKEHAGMHINRATIVVIISVRVQSPLKVRDDNNQFVFLICQLIIFVPSRRDSSF